MVLFSKQEKKIDGDIYGYGDDELSCYVLMLNFLANGKSEITNVVKSKSILTLVDILNQLGASILEKDNEFVVYGVDKNIKLPDNVIDVKELKEILYLVLGLLSSYDLNFFFKGEDKLKSENLEYLFSVYKDLGLSFISRENKFLPFLKMNKAKKPINHEYDSTSCLIKNSLLFAALGSNTKNNVIVERQKSRNHLENLLKIFNIKYDEFEVGIKSNLMTKIGKKIVINGGQSIKNISMNIPTSTKFASYIATIGLLIPDSNILIKNVLVGECRDFYFRTLIDMGADLFFLNQRLVNNEKIVDIAVKYKKIKDFVVPINRVLNLADEYYLFALISAVLGIKVSIQNADFLKKTEGYDDFLKLLNTVKIPYLIKDNTLVLSGEMDVSTTIDTTFIKNNDLLFTAGLFGLFMDNEVTISERINDIYPDLPVFLKGIGLNCE
ncbi:MAG: hypothetical protein LBH46_01860 [Rickettsiales bacterium]|jgi:3-phosphoshikimate 1-carboxyvinyltransferase|nr:hypothetical protein [Rickettsiales bacterium]